MKRLRTPLIVGWALVTAAWPAAVAGARVSHTPSDRIPPRAQLTKYSCRRAIDPGQRAIAVTAVMRPLPGTRHMAIRFTLLRRAPGEATTEVRAGDLGQWTSPSDPTRGQLPGDVWPLYKIVVPLAAPAVYQLQVAFRWTGRGGRTLGTTTRTTPACHQRELRPDLAVRAISVAAIPNRPRHDLYTAQIANTGNSASGPFAVLFAPGDSSPAQTRNLASLAAHSQRSVSFVGPLCTSASAPTITADSALQVQDLDRSDNALTASCPAS
ncbi:MAG TPA: CARDB domain-containing protein [Solirubrobacteraceae bacterium]|nr:CARDB domain-containing protein [Solirubrobacteraceae bacterium]